MNKSIIPAAFAAAVILAGCASPAPVSETPAPVAAPAPVIEEIAPEPIALPPVTAAPAGDSITAWGNGGTWATYMESEDLVRVDGFAVGGANLASIAAQTPACNCDIVVTMAGTNDMGTARWATPLGQRSASLVEIVVKSGARNALIVAVPPMNGGGPWVAEWNAEQARLAAFYGWGYIDPWGPFRAADGGFVPGTSSDHAHPTPVVQEQIGRILHDAIIEAVR